MKHRNKIMELVSLALLFIFAGGVNAQTASEQLAPTVLNRARLGNNNEDITFISGGRFDNHVAFLDGYEVLGLPVSGGDGSEVAKLFDLRDLGIEVGPRGITYIESEDRFALVDPTQVTTLFITDHLGQPQGTRTIQYLGGLAPRHLEGLVYLPPTAGVWADHLILVAFDESFLPRLEVLRRDGQVVAEIFPGEPVGSSFITGVAFKAPDRLLVGLLDNTIWTLDFGGNVVGGPVVLPGVTSVEGLVQLRDGRIVAAAYRAGTLFFFDQDLNRLPADDRDYSIGVGVSLPRGVGWNTDTTEHLILGNATFPAEPELVAVPPSLDSASRVVDLAGDGFSFAFGVTYLPDDNLIAVAHAIAPQAILLYDNSGNLVSQIDLSGVGRPLDISYIPTMREFAVRVSGVGESRRLHLVSRDTGAVMGTIDLSPTGINAVVGVAFFNPAHPSGGQFLVIDSRSTDRAIITDFEGNLLDEFNYRSGLGLLNAQDVSAITTGPQAGAFSIVDTGNSEIVIFTFTPNQPPVADAGSDQTVIVGEEVQFDATGSSDPDGSIVGF